MTTKLKGTGDVLDYGFDLGPALAARGDGLDTVASALLEVSPAGELEVSSGPSIVASPPDSDTPARETSTILFRVAGGVADRHYLVVCTAQTVQGRTVRRRGRIRVRDL